MTTATAATWSTVVDRLPQIDHALVVVLDELEGLVFVTRNASEEGPVITLAELGALSQSIARMTLDLCTAQDRLADIVRIRDDVAFDAEREASNAR
jgi:hypothetical protein